MARVPLIPFRRPRTILLVFLLLLLIGGGLGFRAYALRRWESARAGVNDGRHAEVGGDVRFCLSVWPRSAAVQLLAARAARLNGDFTAAEAHLARCKEIEKGATEAYQLEYLLLRVQGGEVDEVADALMSCVNNKHPESLLILQTVARSYMHNLRCRPALLVLARWMEEDPQSAKPYHWRGWVMERLNNAGAALKDYERALELDPDLMPARLRLAEMLLEDANPPKALPHLEYLLKTHGDRPEVRARLGQCRLLQGLPEEARPLLEAAVAELPNDPPTLVHLAKLEILEGHPEAAERWVRRLLEIDPHDAEAQYALFDSLRLQGRKEDAAAALKQYERTRELLRQAHDLLKQETLHPSIGPTVPYDAGSTLLKIGQERLGLYWLHQALERDPQHRPTHQALADYYEKKGDTERVAAHRRHLDGPAPAP